MSLEQAKLKQVLDEFGYNDELDLLESSLTMSTVPAICMNEGCDYSTEYEPDQDAGYCDFCQETTVKSALMLAGY